MIGTSTESFFYSYRRNVQKGNYCNKRQNQLPEMVYNN